MSSSPPASVPISTHAVPSGAGCTSARLAPHHHERRGLCGWFRGDDTPRGPRRLGGSPVWRAARIRSHVGPLPRDGSHHPVPDVSVYFDTPGHESCARWPSARSARTSTWLRPTVSRASLGRAIASRSPLGGGHRRKRGLRVRLSLLNPVLANDTYFGDRATHRRVLFVMDLGPARGRAVQAPASYPPPRRPPRRPMFAGDRSGAIGRLLRRHLSGVHGPARRCERLPAEPTVTACAVRLAAGSFSSAPRMAVACGRYRSRFTDYAGDGLFNASLPGEESWSAAMVWAGARQLKALGVPTLNLGGGMSEGDSVADFKRRFGAEQVPLRDIMQVYRPARYRGVPHVGAESAAPGYFPAYRHGEP